MTRSPDRPKPFQLLAGHVALDFANTLDARFAPRGPLELLTSYDRLLAFCEEAGVLTGPEARRLRHDVPASDAERALARAIELREAVHALFLSAVHDAPAPPAALRTLNQLLQASEHSQIVASERPRFVWRAAGEEAHAMTPLWCIAAAAAELLTSPDIVHVSECGSETCRWLFLDRSRNHSRRWCEMKTCGNRIKARRFHARQRAPRPRA